MINVNQRMIDPSVARADFSQLTNAVIQGGNVELQASKEKNARIRASLAEVTMNNRASADAQATWMGAISQNQNLLEALNNAPPRIQSAYKKATQGRATLDDNSVIASYLGSIQKQMGLEQQAVAGNLKNDLVKSQIGAQDATRDRQKADMNLANAELNAMKNPGADPRAATIQALLANRMPQTGTKAPVVPTSGGNVPTPPVAAINASDPNDPVARPVSGVALPQPSSASAPAPQAPVAAPQAPVAAPKQAQEVDPNAPFFTDAKGNKVVATPEAINNPLVAAQVADGVDQGTAIQRVQAGMDIKRLTNEYALGEGNVQGLIEPDVYTAKLYASTGDLDDAREQTTAAIEQGMVYKPPTSTEIDERKKEFKEAYEKETAALSTLLEDTQIVQNAADRVTENAGFFTSGAIPSWAAAIGLDVMPFDGKSSVELKRAISQLTSSSALSTMQTLKDNSKQGATGLGQVAVKEFEALIDKASSIDQYLQSGDLEDAVNLYVYDRNKLAYKTYRSMVDKYGKAAVNVKGGISERQVASILRDIDEYERTQPPGIKIAGRSGYFVDNVGVPQAPVTVQSGPNGETPAPAVSAADKKEQSIAAAEAVYEQEKKARQQRNATNVANATKAPLALAGPAGIVPMAAQFVAPKIYDFFGGGNAETEAYSNNISNIQTK